MECCLGLLRKTLSSVWLTNKMTNSVEWITLQCWLQKERSNFRGLNKIKTRVWVITNSFHIPNFALANILRIILCTYKFRYDSELHLHLSFSQPAFYHARSKIYSSYDAQRTGPISEASTRSKLGFGLSAKIHFTFQTSQQNSVKSIFVQQFCVQITNP